MKEVWKPVNGYRGLYEISNLGRVKSIPRPGNCHGNGYIKPYRFIGCNVGKYVTVSFYKNGEQRAYRLHRLLAEHFIPNPDNLPWVNHKDGNKQNNSLDNLEWCTPSWNRYHAFATGLDSHEGERNSNAKVTAREVTFLRLLKTQYPTMSAREIAKFYKVNQKTILDIWNNRQWQSLYRKELSLFQKRQAKNNKV